MEVLFGLLKTCLVSFYGFLFSADIFFTWSFISLHRVSIAVLLSVFDSFDIYESVSDSDSWYLFFLVCLILCYSLFLKILGRGDF